MDIAFNREDIREKFTKNMRIAMECGAVDTAGSIAAMMVNAFNALDRIDAGEPRGPVIDDMTKGHQAIANYFFERERETLVIEQRRLDNMTLEEWAEQRGRTRGV